MSRGGYVVTWGGWGSGEWAYIPAESPEAAVQRAMALGLVSIPKEPIRVVADDQLREADIALMTVDVVWKPPLP